jgi:hypothetical protein
MNLSLSIVFLVLGSFAQSAHAGLDLPQNIPVNPDLTLTTGDVCEKNEAEEFRYKERIPYCRRDVDVTTKEEAFDRYDRKYGLSKKGYTRRGFKIDHFVSLCMGGSNDISNLWPQHLKVSELTDKIEDLLCVELKAGLIKQTQAIDMIRNVKMHLETAPALTAKLIQETANVRR